MKKRIIRGFAGFIILISLGLAVILQELNWLWLTAFVGANLFQSGLTKWCLLEIMLGKLGVKN